MLARGVLAAQGGRVREGLALIRQAVARNPADAEAHAQLARWLSLAHLPDEASKAIERSLACTPREARTFDTLGVVLSRAGDHARAVDCFRRAVALEPGNAGFQFNLSASLTFLGRFDDAEAALEASIAAEPRHWRAHSSLAQLRRQTPERNHVERLRQLLAAGPLDVDAELQLRHALAKECDDLGRYEEAFMHLQAGRSRKRAAVGYDIAADLRLFDAVMAACPDPLPIDAAPVEQAPIFVVGLPRTGTTLVERILSSHARVATVGESQNFGVLLKRASGTREPTVLDSATIDWASRHDLGEVGRRYLAQTRPPGDRPRFVDKLPLNFFYLGCIARALPGARIVVVRRDPRDTVIANFSQLFATTMPYYRYALDAVDIARYWLRFDALIAHWRRVLPGRLHEVQYERLVAEPRAAIEPMLGHCGLDWDPACLDFQHNAAPVATASAVQVRSPLYASSIGRWRRYAPQLEPALAVLRAAGLDL